PGRQRRAGPEGSGPSPPESPGIGRAGGLRTGGAGHQMVYLTGVLNVSVPSVPIGSGNRSHSFRFHRFPPYRWEPIREPQLGTATRSHLGTDTGTAGIDEVTGA